MIRTRYKSRKPRNGLRPAPAARPEGAALPEDYEAHFHEAASGYLVLSGDGTILAANRTLAGWIGRHRDKIVGSNVVELMPVAEQVLYASHVGPQLAVSGSFHELALDLLSADGGSVPVLLSGARAEQPDGAVIDRITVFKATERRIYERDLVAALRKAEAAEAARAAVEVELREKQRALEEKDRILQENLAESVKERALLETVLNTADVGLLVVDTQGNIVMANDHLTYTWQDTMGDVPVTTAGVPAFSADRTTPLPEAENPVRRAAAGKTFSDQLLWFGTGEKQLAASVSARPIKANGALSGSVIAFHDVSRLVRALAAQEEFVANVSHELRTPLTSIMGYLDLVLEDANLPSHLAGALNVAVRNSERLLALVSDLLSVASGSAKPQRRPVNLAEVVRTGIHSLRSKAAASGVDFLPEIPVSVVANVDPERVAEVIGNLLSNAVKYSPDGGTVYVQLWQQGQTVCLRIADTGMGMSEAEQEKVFTKFFRARRADTSAVPGAGLGLTISKGIVEEHGGKLSFVSTPGEGSVFTVTLPVNAEIAALNR